MARVRGSSGAARSVAASPSASARARNFSSRSPVTSVTGIVSSGRRSQTAPSRPSRGRAALPRDRRACCAGGRRRPPLRRFGLAGEQRQAPPFARERLDADRLDPSASARRPCPRASRSSGSSRPGSRRSGPAGRRSPAERQRGVERDPAAHPVAGERERLRRSERRRVGGAASKLGVRVRRLAVAGEVRDSSRDSVRPAPLRPPPALAGLREAVQEDERRQHHAPSCPEPTPTSACAPSSTSSPAAACATPAPPPARARRRWC